MLYDCIVVGRGLFAAAALRRLARAGKSVALVGPQEPHDWQTHAGPFASHYDQGRITRRLSASDTWADLAQEAIDEYATIERESDIRFHFAVGLLYIGAAGESMLSALRQVAARRAIDVAYLADGEQIATRGAHLAVPAGYASLYEDAPAGYINPRDLVRAQLKVGADHGAQLIDDWVAAIDDRGDRIEAQLHSGGTVAAKQIIVAAGAYTDGLLPEPLGLRIKTEFVILAQLPPAEARRLQKMPALIYDIDSAQLSDIYLLPPIRYPDGRIYLKMGANTAADHTLADAAAANEWMQHGDSEVMRPALQSALQSLLPSVQVAHWQMKRCLVTYSADRKPLIKRLGPRLVVVTAGNGHGAKSSVAIGGKAAELVLQS